MTQQEKDIMVLIQYSRIQAAIARRCAGEALNSTRMVLGQSLGYTEDFFFDIERDLENCSSELQKLLEADINGQ